MIPSEDIRYEFVSTRPKGQVSPVLDRGGVRAIHLPSKTEVTIFDQRSQHANRAAAERMLEFYLTDPENR